MFDLEKELEGLQAKFRAEVEAFHQEAQKELSLFHDAIEQAKAQVAAVAAAEKGSIPDFAKRLEGAENYFEGRANFWEERIAHVEQSYDQWFTKLNEHVDSLKARQDAYIQRMDNYLADFTKQVGEARVSFAEVFNQEAAELTGKMRVLAFDAIKDEVVKQLVKSFSEMFKGGIMIIRNAYPHEIKEGKAIPVRNASHVEVAQAEGRA